MSNRMSISCPGFTAKPLIPCRKPTALPRLSQPRSGLFSNAAHRPIPLRNTAPHDVRGHAKPGLSPEQVAPETY